MLQAIPTAQHNIRCKILDSTACTWLRSKPHGARNALLYVCTSVSFHIYGLFILGMFVFRAVFKLNKYFMDICNCSVGRVYLAL